MRNPDWTSPCGTVQLHLADATCGTRDRTSPAFRHGKRLRIGDMIFHSRRKLRWRTCDIGTQMATYAKNASRKGCTNAAAHIESRFEGCRWRVLDCETRGCGSQDWRCGCRASLRCDGGRSRSAAKDAPNASPSPRGADISHDLGPTSSRTEQRTHATNGLFRRLGAWGGGQSLAGGIRSSGRSAFAATTHSPREMCFRMSTSTATSGLALACRCAEQPSVAPVQVQ